MKQLPVDWEEKRKKGFVRYLLVDGILLTGGAFAVVLQIAGYFLLADEGQTLGQYFTSQRTWLTFFFHGTLFGGIMGLINWKRNERLFESAGGDANVRSETPKS